MPLRRESGRFKHKTGRLRSPRIRPDLPLLRHSFDARYSLRAINGPHGGVLGQLPKTMKPTPFTSDAEPPPPRGGPLVTVGLASWPLRFRMCRRADTGAGGDRLARSYGLEWRSGSPVSRLTGTATCSIVTSQWPSILR